MVCRARRSLKSRRNQWGAYLTTAFTEKPQHRIGAEAGGVDSEAQG